MTRRWTNAWMLWTVWALGLLPIACDPGTSSRPGPDALLESDGESVDPGPQVHPAPAAATCEANPDPLPEAFVPSDPASLPFLHVDQTRLLDEAGNEVFLRGVNLGSWLQVEAWIPGLGVLTQEELLAAFQAKADSMGLGDLLREARAQNEPELALELKPVWTCVREWREFLYKATDPDQSELVDSLWEWFDAQPWPFEEEGLRRWLTVRFGAAGEAALRATFRDHWITEEDFRRIAALGLNLVRVPVWYQALETDGHLAVHFDPDGWKRLDDVVTWARRHKLYVGIDLHGAPGGQSTASHQGLQEGGRLFQDADCIARSARLWKAIATRYAGEPHVAFYDLLNEPMAVASADQYRAAHDPMYRAVREADTRHVVMAEDGYRSPAMIVSPKEMGWENAMFSIHEYPTGLADGAAYGAAIDARLGSVETRFDWAKRFACPLLLGEFNAAPAVPSDPVQGAAGMDAALAAANGRGVHWAVWSWKGTWGGNTWGIVHPTGAADGRRIDVTGPLDAIRTAFEALDSGGYETMSEYASVLTKRAAEAIPPPVR